MQALQQQAEGLIAAISRNQQSKASTQQDLVELQQQLQEQQAQHAVAREQLQQLQEQQRALQQQVAAAEQQLAERERQQQQVAADVSEKQHALQVTRGECAAAQDKLSQVGTQCAHQGHPRPRFAIQCIRVPLLAQRWRSVAGLIRHLAQFAQVASNWRCDSCCSC